MKSHAAIAARLEAARQELLDLSTRNRLIHVPRGRTRLRNIPLLGEQSAEIFRILVLERKSMSFAPAADAPAEHQAGPPPDLLADEAKPSPEQSTPDTSQDSSEAATVAQPPAAEAHDEPPPAATKPPASATLPVDPGPPRAAVPPGAHFTRAAVAQHGDRVLQTRLPADDLQKRLLAMYYDARTHEEEQGVNILFLALGFLKWYETPQGEQARYAPLLLLPVELERQQAAARFTIKWLESEIETNLSLQAKLRREFHLELPEVPDIEDLDVDAYFQAVREAVAAAPRWEVIADEQILWFFSFARFLMYRDLDAATWPPDRPLLSQPLIQALLDEGFAPAPPLCEEDENVDARIPADAVHVLDADSSQSVAIEEVRQGRNLVIQGPPGTGKSQTISNMIAAAVHAGKTVLFVAEKMAALEVVKRRLDHLGLGHICLELHSHKANKRALLDQLQAGLEAPRPPDGGVEEQARGLQAAREQLNAYVQMMHTPLASAQRSPYEIVSRLVELRAQGTAAPDFSLDGAVSWGPENVRQRQAMVGEAAQRALELGVPPKGHPWRGVRVTTLLPTDVERALGGLGPAIAALERLTSAGVELSGALGLPALSLGDHQRLVRAFKAWKNAPPLDRAALAHHVWLQQRTEIATLLRHGLAYRTSRAALAGVLAESVWSSSAPPAEHWMDVRRQLAAHGRSWFCWFSPQYRWARSELLSVLAAGKRLPWSHAARLQMLDHLLAGLHAAAAIANRDELGRQAFGSLWQGTQSDWQALAAIERWEQNCRDAGVPENFRYAALPADGLAALESATQRVEEQLEPARRALETAGAVFQWSAAAAFQVPRNEDAPLGEVVAIWRQWQAAPAGYARFAAWQAASDALAAGGLSAVAERLYDGRLVPEAAIAAFETAWCEALLRHVLGQHPELAEFQGPVHERLRAEFRRLDLERLQRARRQVARAHYEQLPRGGALGEIGIVRREIEKKRRHLPPRQLLLQAGNAVQRIKPVFMMSPISVAQFLAPGHLCFDLLLIDEASQVRPVDALGAIARARQIVVVGDDRQLPPTRFFHKLLAEESQQEDEASETADLESILGLCNAQRMTRRMLKWHYRSRHHSLIAVSNREFYDDRLLIPPSPRERDPQLGLRLHYLPEGVFDRGGTAVNRVEALAVARAVMAHAKNLPDVTLGVGTFSVAQRDAILDALEDLRQQDPSLEPFFATSKPEPFFVKNLESIQGDERDCIFISVGYGRDATGGLTMNFGPLNASGGERRLNVLITRARLRCEVFTSLRAEDIDVKRAPSAGPRALRAFLEYAASGELATQREKSTDSGGLEHHLVELLRRQGLVVRERVGVAGCFVDVAVDAGEGQGAARVIGVECDGVSYQQGRSARDRDRLREQLLRDRGWQVHRVWALDWLRQPDDELRKLLDFIASGTVTSAELPATASEKTSRRGALDSLARDAPRGSTSRFADADEDREEDPLAAPPYRLASVRYGASAPWQEQPLGKRVEFVRKILEVEGPVHGDEVARRVAAAAGKRTSQTLSDAVLEALEEAVRQGLAHEEEGFFDVQPPRKSLVRDRADVDSPTLRKPEMLPPAEIRQALINTVRAHVGASPEDVITGSARLLGFRATSKELAGIIGRQIDRLLGDGKLTERNGNLYLPSSGAQTT